MTTAEKNAAIARWMGAKQYTSYFKFGAKTHPEIFDFGNGKTFKQRQLKYHSDWNWIMLCVSKIEDLNYDVKILGGCWVIITDCDPNRNESDDIIETSKESKILSAHEAVYQFVVWHNQQVKETPKP